MRRKRWHNERPFSIAGFQPGWLRFAVYGGLLLIVLLIYLNPPQPSLEEIEAADFMRMAGSRSEAGQRYVQVHPGLSTAPPEMAGLGLLEQPLSGITTGSIPGAPGGYRLSAQAPDGGTLLADVQGRLFELRQDGMLQQQTRASLLGMPQELLVAADGSTLICTLDTVQLSASGGLKLWAFHPDERTLMEYGSFTGWWLNTTTGETVLAYHKNAPRYQQRGILAGFARDGSPQWSQQLEEPIVSPLLEAGGSLYCLSAPYPAQRPLTLHCFRTDGKAAWSRKLDEHYGLTSLAAAGSRLLLFERSVTDEPDRLSSIVGDGTKVWTAELERAAGHEPVVQGERILHLTAAHGRPDDCTLQALNARDGSAQWSLALGFRPVSPPQVQADGSIYLQSSRMLLRIESDGSPAWTLHCIAGFEAGAVQEAGDTVFVLGKGAIYTLRRDGSGLRHWAISDHNYPLALIGTATGVLLDATPDCLLLREPE